ncbi:LacI family DNA-binding transcriptional regulator [Collinsella sp. BM28]|uniref:LacI family DNA-binding transcriptional regulator n=1 Tax=Collinsella sp. BM28 TaxID=3378285 RepID=UPI003891DC35
MSEPVTSSDGAAATGARSGRAVSMADVARLAGVSRQTVSRVVNGQSCVVEETRKRVMDAMDELGFYPSFAGRSLRGGKYGCIGLCMFDITRAGNVATLDGIVSAARDCKYAVTLVEFDEGGPVRLRDVARRLAELPVDGMVFNTNRAVEDFEEFEPVQGLPTIIISMKEHPRCTTIDSDQYGCSTMVVDYLRERGHRHIRHLAGPAGSITADFRLQGWRDALDTAGLEAVEPLRGDWTADSGYELGAKLARDEEMTALYVANDQMAMGAMTALRIHGRRVPEDVSVVGVDDSLQGMVPHNTLTTVRFDLRERGRRTFDQFFAQVSGEGSVDAIRLPGEIIERSTVARRA